MKRFLMQLALLDLILQSFVQAQRRAEWMSGRWGIGYRIDATKDMNLDYDVDYFIEQLRTIKGDPGWIIVNLSGPATEGDVYLSYNPTLWEIGNVNAVPGPDDRDLFWELLTKIKGEGLKVIAYMATQGPALLKAGVATAHDWNGTHSPAYENWIANCTATYGNASDASLMLHYANKIVLYYSELYGEDLDGWWFDQCNFGNRTAITEAVRAGNPNAVLALNYGQKVPLTVNNPGLEDFTFGHPNVITKYSPSNDVNLPMITSIEATVDGFISNYGVEVLGHCFMPMGTSWNGINIYTTFLEWTEQRALEWMHRVLESGGAWTWNIPRNGWYPDPEVSRLRTDFVDFLNIVVNQLAPSSVPSVSLRPSYVPSSIPSSSPSSHPSVLPTSAPSSIPSSTPSSRPSLLLTSSPSEVPSKDTSVSPSGANIAPVSTTTGADLLDEVLSAAIFPPTGNQCSGAGTTTSFRTHFATTMSISSWNAQNSQFESDIFDIDMIHTDSHANRTWSLRLGKGGQVASLITKAGEAVANQPSSTSAWNDLVYQMVAVNENLNNPSAGMRNFIHQAGVYMQDTGLPPPFNSPKVARECAGNQCSIVNWGQQAHVPTTFDSPLLYYTRYRDCGNGIIEYDMAMHHFGQDEADIYSYFNTPWMGVRTSTFPDLLIANKTGTLVHQWPMKTWGFNVDINLRDTGGFSTFAEDLELSSDQFDFGFCIDNTKSGDHTAANTACDENNPDIIPFQFVVQADNTASQTSHSATYGFDYTVRMRLCNLAGAVMIGNMGWGNFWQGVLLINDRNGFTFQSRYIVHYCWLGEWAYFESANATASQLNDNFRQGDTITVKLVASGRAYSDQIGFTLVHGKNPEYDSPDNSFFYKARSRIRYGVTDAIRDGTVLTTNWMGYLNPSDTYFSRKYLIVDTLSNMEIVASNLVEETYEDVLRVTELPEGNTIQLWKRSDGFGATIGNDNICYGSSLVCTGNSTPEQGFRPLFHISCGSNKATAHDPYTFSIVDDGNNKKPYLCVGEAESVRAEWKLLGFFPDGACDTIGSLVYSSTFCPEFISPSESAYPSFQPLSVPSGSPSTPPSMGPSFTHSSHPSLSYSTSPSSEPSSVPSSSPSLVHSMGPSARPSSDPSSHPSSGPSSGPSVLHSPTPSSEPSSVPSSSPSLVHSLGPSVTPSSDPSSHPSSGPSSGPSLLRSPTPSLEPSSVPISSPSEPPSVAHSMGPSVMPSSGPSFSPSLPPSSDPSSLSTLLQSSRPSSSNLPSSSPSTRPSMSPSVGPSAGPSSSPSAVESSVPSTAPITVLSRGPSLEPSPAPTTSPSVANSMGPSDAPSSDPTFSPSLQPSVGPTTSIDPTTTPSFSIEPSRAPTSRPTQSPSVFSSTEPSKIESSVPSESVLPTEKPSEFQSSIPSTMHSSTPSLEPTASPSRDPSSKPSDKPSAAPSLPKVDPTRKPSSKPSARPTERQTKPPKPSPKPSARPTELQTKPPKPQPSEVPTETPFSSKSDLPTISSSAHPSDMPSKFSEPPFHREIPRETHFPSFVSQPTFPDPSLFPSPSPSKASSRRPSIDPAQLPSSAPSLHCAENEQLIQLYIKTDLYPEETTWELADFSKEHKFGGGPYEWAKHDYNEDFCVPERPYEFKIKDSYDDGLCCNWGLGSYTLIVDGETIKSGGEFRSEDRTSIMPECSRGESRIQINITTDYFGSETSWTMSTSSGAIVLFGTAFEPWESRIFTTCLSALDCYKFIIQDTYGDGLCCSYGFGGYMIEFNGKNYSGSFIRGFEETVEIGSLCPSISLDPAVIYESRRGRRHHKNREGEDIRRAQYEAALAELQKALMYRAEKVPVIEVVTQSPQTIPPEIPQSSEPISDRGGDSPGQGPSSGNEIHPIIMLPPARKRRKPSNGQSSDSTSVRGGGKTVSGESVVIDITGNLETTMGSLAPRRMRRGDSMG